MFARARYLCWEDIARVDGVVGGFEVGGEGGDLCAEIVFVGVMGGFS